MFSIDTYQGGVVLIALVVAIAVGGLFLARKAFDLEHLKETHEVGGVLFSAIGTLYAVLLGLIVVDAMSKFTVTRDIVQNEANNVANVYILSDCLTEDKKIPMRALCVDYCKEVINHEWAAMDDAKFSPVARKLAVKILEDATNFEPKSQNQQSLYPILVQSALNIWDFRCDRINIARAGIPVIEWATLIAGGFITVFFTYFFGLDRIKIQIAMVSMVTVLISLNLYLFMLFGYPFSGDVSISPEAFQVDLDIFEKKIQSSEEKWN